MVAELEEREILGLKSALITILHSHRFRKKDQFLEGLDFSIIRDVLYNYTTEARQRILSEPYFAFLFHHFVSQGGSQFLVSRAHGKPSLYAEELEKELSTLDKEAETVLNSFLS